MKQIWKYFAYLLPECMMGMANFSVKSKVNRIEETFLFKGKKPFNRKHIIFIPTPLDMGKISFCDKAILLFHLIKVIYLYRPFKAAERISRQLLEPFLISKLVETTSSSWPFVLIFINFYNQLEKNRK